MIRGKHTLTSLASLAGVSYNTLKKDVLIMLQDQEIRKQFGPWKAKRPLSSKQLQILIENIPYIE